MSTTITATPKPTESKWIFTGYWDALIGGFILIIQGFLAFFSQLSGGLGVFGGMSFFALTEVWWLSALLSLLLGILVLFLIWKWLLDKIGMKPLIKDTMWLGIILLIIGLITGGTGGVLVFIGGIFYLLSLSK
ncbi:MAG: hypothetical protein HGN29_12720 [Asgard group archaeon]|nr:hypothetical protein [Asgard group archaeon]